MRWIVKQVDQSQVEFLRSKLNISEFLARLLVNRGLSDPQQAERFLYPTPQDLHDPFILLDMKKACDLLFLAREENSPVLIYGDYDVDGITGTAVLEEFLKSNGWQVEHYIPKRLDEGYGIQPEVVRQFAESGGKLIVTVDCGITAFDSINLANSLGCKVIVTDHHEVGPGLPNAEAIVNPKRPDDPYPFKDLAGTGVAFKVVCALAERLGLSQERIYEYLDLVALGTVADMVRLVDENRFIVKKGLELMKSTKKPGLETLLFRLGISNPDSRDIGYRVAPKLNAAGRLDYAEDAYKLLTVKDHQTAANLVNLLFEYNTTRQEIESEIYSMAVKQIEEHELYKYSIIVAYGQNWHVGVLGIVATRLCQRYGKPVLVISVGEDEARGSARSPENINLMEVLQPFSAYFKEFGGHSFAVGFTIDLDLIEPFVEKLKDYHIPIAESQDQIEVDSEITLHQIGDEFLAQLKMLEPFGNGNPEPVFVAKDVSVESAKIFGPNDSNLKLTVTSGTKRFEAFGFGLGQFVEESLLNRFAKANLIFTIKRNGQQPVLNLLDIILEEPDSGSSVPSEKIPFVHRSSQLEEILSNLKGREFFVVDIRTRNSIYKWLLENSKARIVVVSPNNVIALQAYQSLQRYAVNSVDYLNSLSKNSSHRFAFVTVVYFVEQFERMLRTYDLLIINELSLFKTFADNPYVRKFFDIVKRHPSKFITLTVKCPDDLFDLAGELGFSLVYQKNSRPTFGLVDVPAGLESVLNDATCFLFSSKLNLRNFYKKVSQIWKPADFLVYTHGLKPQQRNIIVSQIKKRRFKKLLCTTNTDGIPSMLWQDVEMAIGDVPLTLFEILDSLSFDGTSQIIDLCFDTKDIQAREEELKELFPTHEKLEQVLQLFGSKQVEEDHFLADLVRNNFVRSVSYAKVLLSVLKELGADTTNGHIDLSRVDLCNSSWRMAEGDLDIAYFDTVTKPYLLQRAKGICKVLMSHKAVI